MESSGAIFFEINASMKNKVLDEKKISYSRPCYIDGYYFPSLFSMSIDFEFSYHMLHSKIKKHGGAPIVYSGHKIVMEEWLELHPEYDIAKDKKELNK